MTLQSLYVEGVKVKDLDHYSLRWACEGGGHTPVLYRDGKRVTREWCLFMSADLPKDRHGGNANTE